MAGQVHVIYDGNCGLCNGSVQWLKSKDPEGILVFTPLQDPEVLTCYNIPYQEAISELQAVIEGKRYRGVEAVLRVLSHLPGYRWMKVGLRSKTFMRIAGFLYRQIAKRRMMFNKIARPH